MNESVDNQVRHLYEVEGLSMRQIAGELGISKKRISRIIKKESLTKPPADSILKPFERLISQWYQEHPTLKATQVYERLKSYGFGGSYPTVIVYTRRYRKKRSIPYHELSFLPGEEAQVDWMIVTGLPFGVAYGFVFLLAYSRYLFVRFYPRHSLEFFLDGHIEAYREIGGVARRNRYDNLRSVVLSRSPEVRFNPQFLDFARHYGFSIHPCNPYRANEKGRVERVIRDIRDHIGISTFTDMADLNRKVNLWRMERNGRLHRSTGKPPSGALSEERLLALPAIPYKPYRPVVGVAGKTGFVEFDANRYSLPSEYSDKSCEILAYPDHIEILSGGKKVATHPRSFGRGHKIENPAHRERLLRITPNFKYQRIYQLIQGMDSCMEQFLKRAEAEGDDPERVSYEFFRLLKHISKGMLLSAVREANDIGVYKVKYIHSLLRLPSGTQDSPVYPQDQRLLEIEYEGRELTDYDEFI